MTLTSPSLQTRTSRISTVVLLQELLSSQHLPFLPCCSGPACSLGATAAADGGRSCGRRAESKPKLSELVKNSIPYVVCAVCGVCFEAPKEF